MSLGRINGYGMVFCASVQLQKPSLPFHSTSSCISLVLLFVYGFKAAHAWQMVDQLDSPHDFRASTYYNHDTLPIRPLLIRNYVSLDDCEACANVILQSDATVDLQQQQQHGKIMQTKIHHNVALEDAIDAILYQSTSRNAFLTFSEGLLEQTSFTSSTTTNINNVLTQARGEGLFDKNDVDWFHHYFPPHIQPSDAIILAGMGATSTLHRDPFEWMGTNLCLEGTKLWRFVEPSNGNVEIIDDMLESYRLNSIAWDGSSNDDKQQQQVVTSCGWQSDYSLFHHRKHDMLPTMQELHDMDPVEQRKHMEMIAMDETILRPHDKVGDVNMYTAIQQPGDLLLIPAYWWHQTYGLEPSAAIASQRCGTNEAPQVLQHILNCREVSSVTARTILQQDLDSSPVEALHTVLNAK